ncbi:MAG: alanine--tRNA ligase [Candidatus Omnitrophota bacterium]
MKTNEIRTKFLDFFKNKQHTIFNSDTLVPDDPTVLFTSAGMNQFKPYFLGEHRDLKRAASCQKCFRTGDLDEVGKTPFHHTFFEMLGNFSFGDYFKIEAVEFAWEFLLKHLNLRENMLWVSVYNDDKEAYEIWLKSIGIPKEKIVKLGEDKNFWPANALSLGPNGPCGPCSEIFFDKGKNYGCGKEICSPACGCARFVEIWNLVFTQFNRIGENKLDRLPQKNIDTGMGLERIASVMQGKSTNFEIDIFAPAVTLVKDILRIPHSEFRDTSLINAIVDHARAAVFAISDGVYPSNEERGYVIRKVIRKALWSAYLLGRKEPFLNELTDCYGELMKEAYPEVSEKKDTIKKIIKAEEEKFFSTLKDGKVQLSAVINELKEQKKATVSAESLFSLYDTYGFPIELSKFIAKEHNLNVDEGGFTRLLREQQERSRKGSMFDESIFKESGLKFDEHTDFAGYSSFESKGKIIRLIHENKDVDSIDEGKVAFVIPDKTPFYSEGGGQLTDKGVILTSSGRFRVDEVFKTGSAIIHKGLIEQGKLAKTDCDLAVDPCRRRALMRSHTATHLLQYALRKVLGKHVCQQGSLVDCDRLRFDFTHFKALSADEQRKVESLVNDLIEKTVPVAKNTVCLDKAKKQGALAFFKDKYSREVRMVSIGDWSIELCGGTHLEDTSQAGMFVILSESSISSGVRRIEAVTGRKAYEKFSEGKEASEKTAALLKCDTNSIEAVVKRLLSEIKEKDDIITSLEAASFKEQAAMVVKSAKKIRDINVILSADVLPGSFSRSRRVFGMKQLMFLLDKVKQECPSGFIFLTFFDAQNSNFLCSVTDDLVKRGISALEFFKLNKNELTLKGGGRDSLIQGVLTDNWQVNDYLTKVQARISGYLENILKA